MHPLLAHVDASAAMQERAPRRMLVVGMWMLDCDEVNATMGSDMLEWE